LFNSTNKIIIKKGRRWLSTTSWWMDPIAYFSIKYLLVVFTISMFFSFQLMWAFFVVGWLSLKIKQLNCQGTRNQPP